MNPCIYPDDTKEESLPVEAAYLAAMSDAAPASALYDIAKQIWGLYYRCKSERSSRVESVDDYLL